MTNFNLGGVENVNDITTATPKMSREQATKPIPVKLPNFIASNLRVLRKLHGWSQAELGERVHLNRGNIASYESGSAEPNICKTLRISNLFEVNPRDLIRRDLSDPQELLLAQIARSQESEAGMDRVAELKAEATQLEALIRSSRALFEYKRDSLESPCAEAELFAAHYEQLYQVTTQLTRNHLTLLAEISCQCD